MKGELAAATAELNEALELLSKAVESIIEDPSRSPDEIVEKLAERNPSLIEQVRAMEGPPKNTLEFWVRFSIWTISELRDKYDHIWHEVIKAYWKSDSAKKGSAGTKLKTQI